MSKPFGTLPPDGEIQVKVALSVTHQELADVIISGVEGGISYWARVKDYRWDCTPSMTHVVLQEDFPAEECVLSGWHMLGIKDIARGMSIAAEKYPHVMAQWLRDRNGDAGTSDVFIQCALFGEAVYG